MGWRTTGDVAEFLTAAGDFLRGERGQVGVRTRARLYRLAELSWPDPLPDGHGYGTAVTAAVSQRVLAAGAEEVLLYTDLANPVSNSIHQRSGHRPVEDRVMLSFTPLGSAP
jgi:hypothetical protein